MIESFYVYVKNSWIWWTRRLSVLFDYFMSCWFRASILRLVDFFLFFFNMGSYLLKGIWIGSLKLLGLAALWWRGFYLTRDALELQIPELLNWLKCTALPTMTLLWRRHSQDFNLSLPWFRTHDIVSTHRLLIIFVGTWLLALFLRDRRILSVIKAYSSAFHVFLCLDMLKPWRWYESICRPALNRHPMPQVILVPQLLEKLWVLSPRRKRSKIGILRILKRWITFLF